MQVAGATPFYMTMYPSRSIAPVTVADAVGLPYAKMTTGSGVSGGRGQATLSSYMRTKKFVGRTVADVDYTAAVTSAPTRVWYWHIRTQNADGATNINQAWYYKMNFYVKFWNRKVLID